MGQYEFLANFDSDEAVFPMPPHDRLTVPEVLQLLDRNYTLLPDAYVFKRVYFPDAEDRNTRT